MAPIPPHDNLLEPAQAIAADCAASVKRFDIRAEAEPATLVRLLDLFAQRSLVPTEVHALALQGELQATITLQDLDTATARNLCARMGNMIGVRAARFSPAAYINVSITPPSTRNAAPVVAEA